MVQAQFAWFFWKGRVFILEAHIHLTSILSIMPYGAFWRARCVLLLTQIWPLSELLSSKHGTKSPRIPCDTWYIIFLSI
jgi:hypothetical protein